MISVFLRRFVKVFLELVLVFLSVVVYVFSAFVFFDERE